MNSKVAKFLNEGATSCSHVIRETELKGNSTRALKINTAKRAASRSHPVALSRYFSCGADYHLRMREKFTPIYNHAPTTHPDFRLYSHLTRETIMVFPALTALLLGQLPALGRPFPVVAGTITVSNYSRSKIKYKLTVRGVAHVLDFSTHTTDSPGSVGEGSTDRTIHDVLQNMFAIYEVLWSNSCPTLGCVLGIVSSGFLALGTK